MWYSVNQLLQTGKNAVICTPYIICGKEMYADLKNTCEQGTNVEIITNDVSSGANPWGCTDYLNQKRKNLGNRCAGARISGVSFQSYQSSAH